MNMEPLRIAVMPINEAKSFQDDLLKEGVELVLNHNEQTCTRGCSVTVEVLGYEKDIPKIIEKYENNYKKLLDGHDVNLEIINSVFDPNKATATCPACGTDFATTHTECPECGLFIG